MNRASSPRVPIRMVGSVVTAALLLAVSLASCSSGDSVDDANSAPSADARESPRRTPPDDTPGEGGPSERDDLPEEYATLLRTVRDDGSATVIVRLKLESTPTPRAEHQKVISDAQRKMLDELEEYDVQPGRTYQRWPMFSATVDEEALRHLFSSPDVDRVWKNRVHKVE